MKNIRVYDFPTRIFHWLFAAYFIGAFFIAKTYDDDSIQYPYHMLMGLTLAYMVVLRILWGFVGGKYSKFNSFQLQPKMLVQYFKDLMTSKTQKTLGHNPASSWAAVTMMLLALGMATTGILMAKDMNKEFVEEIHEIFAYAFVVVVVGHVVGVIIHTIRHKEMIGLSMVTGNKKTEDVKAISQPANWMAGIVFLVMIFIFLGYVSKNFDNKAGTLKIFGTTLQLGEGAEPGAIDSGSTEMNTGMAPEDERYGLGSGTENSPNDSTPSEEEASPSENGNE